MLDHLKEMRLHHDLETAELRMRVRSASTVERALAGWRCSQVGRLELERDGAISDGVKAASEAEAGTCALLLWRYTIRPHAQIAAKQCLMEGHEAELGVLRRELQELAKQLGLVEDRAARDRTRIEEQHAAWAEQARIGRVHDF